MEFRPFWEVLEKLGIALPDPSKLRAAKRRKPASSTQNARIASSGFRALPRDTDSLLELLDLMVEPGAFEDERATSDDCWVPFGETVKVSTYTLPGMVYVGEDLSSVRSYGVEPCLIRPSLRVSRKASDYEKAPSTYSLSYTQMQPDNRSAYLRWLAEGRCAPKVYSGYVLLFFYGLERRVLHDLLHVDLKTDPVKRQELDQIMVEVKRLQTLYGNLSTNWSFGSKAESFLEICRLVRSHNALPGESPDFGDPIDNPLDAKPFALQVGLGQKVKQGEPIPADWALAWYVRLANNALPTAASRCLEEFKTLFRLRYEQDYGEGIKLKHGKVKLKTSYYPANPSFGRSLEINVGDLPDISRFTAKVTQIGTLVQQCRLELDPLSRLLGRNPDARDTPAAIALLPPDLLPTYGGKVWQQVQQWLQQHFSKPETQVAVVSGKEVLQHWSGSNPEKLTKTEAVGLSQILARLGYGMEPDPRFGGALPTLKTPLALFRLPSDHPDALSAAYFEATLLIHLAIVVASGDDVPSLLEQQYLSTHLSAMVTVSNAERSRLNAHQQWLLQEKLTLRSLKARVEPISSAQRRNIAHFIIQVAAADGQLKPKEVQLLEKVYALLELDAQTVYSDIHDFSTTARQPVAQEPVTVRRASPKSGRKIPAAPPGKRSQTEAVPLDMALVQSKLDESNAISHLLAEIFVDQEEPTKDKTKPLKGTQAKRRQSASASPTPVRTIAGLDGAHAELLFALAKQAVWQRDDLSAIATQLGLLLDGALEVINETAFDRCDEAVIEGDNPLEVNCDVLRELLA